MENRIMMRVLSKKCNIAIVRNMLGAMLIDNNPTLTFINELKTIVSEAVTNAIVHGYEDNEDSYVDILVELSSLCIYIEVKDEGVGIEDINKAKEALYSSKANEERSGLGFTIMELFSDELEVISKVNEGTIIKIRKNW